MAHIFIPIAGGEVEIEERRFLGLWRKKILRFLPDPEEGTLMAALVQGITVNGIPLPPGTAMVANIEDRVVLPGGKAYRTVKPVK